MVDKPGLKDDVQRVAEGGRRGDDQLAHINKREAMILALMGGAGTRNPRTGILEFYDGGDGQGGAETGGDNAGGRGDTSGGGYGDPMGSGYDYGYSPQGNLTPGAAQSLGQANQDVGGINQDHTTSQVARNYVFSLPMVGMFARAGSAVGDAARARGMSVNNEPMNANPFGGHDPKNIAMANALRTGV